MDHSAVANDKEESILADKMRLDSFRLGKIPSNMNMSQNGPKSSHARSHSRNGSVSVPLAFPTPATFTSSATSTEEPPASPSWNSLGASKRSSHHRRRSSVSTRRESADMMGVSLPAISPSVSDDNINLGDKDSIRRRALWTLEGKTDVGTFSKVEIPELDTAGAAKKPFDLPTRPSYPPGLGASFGGGLSSLMGSKRDSLGSKRESFGKLMASTSSKEQLHTLMEEEEEEEEEHEEDGKDKAVLVASPVQESEPEPKSVVPSPDVTTVTSSPALTRRRPASLNLRPLSLASGSIVQASNGDLPTPALTRSSRPGLKSLTLACSPSIGSGLASTSAVANKRQSLIITSSPSPLSGAFARRSSVSVAADYPPPLPAPARRSSISYVSSSDTPPQSVIGLPTPEMTPTSTTGRRSASASIDMDQPARPLSASEQHFLFQAHKTLVQRITDLERALSSRSSRSWSRPLSMASDVSAASVCSALSEPSDEMLQLIADLKAERDELKKDVDGWRMRVGDLERQVGVLAKRVEVERRDAWVARERVGLLDVEKNTLETALGEKTVHAKEGWERFELAKEHGEKMEKECEKLKGEVERLREFEDECVRLRAALDAERRKREELERDLDHAGLLSTPRAFDAPIQPLPTISSRTMMFAKTRGLGFQSIDSEGSFTDVESVDSPRDKSEFGLKAVEEEDEVDGREETLSNFSEEDELARYEDEEENDVHAFPPSNSASSFGDGENNTCTSPKPQSNIHDPAPALTRSNSSSPTPLPSPVDQSHTRRASLSKTWTFPSGCELTSSFGHREEIDRFFDCLEDVDNSPPLDSRLHSLESGKNLFSQALAEDDDELPPFVLPADVGVEVISPEIKPKPVLDVVVEEDEDEDDEDDEVTERMDPNDEFVGEVDEGGIKFTFTLPAEFAESQAVADVSTPDSKVCKTVPPPFDEYEQASTDFTFPQSRLQQSISAPSSIPRPASAKTLSSAIPVPKVSTPVKPNNVVLPRIRQSPSAFMTPPAKRGASPTFIPQPRSQPETPSKTPSSPSKIASFIPQAKRTSSPASKTSAIPVIPTTNTTNVFSRFYAVTKPPSASPEMSNRILIDPEDPFAVTSPVDSEPSSSSPTSLSPRITMSPTLATRISFQKLTNLIPMPSLPWSPRSSSKGSATTATATATALCFIPESNSTSSTASEDVINEHNRASSSFVNSRPAVAQSRQRGYVSKERQLERLRVRLEEERRVKVRSAVNVGNEKPQDGVLHI
ncbi:hypothetical protein AcW2_006809 [Taiwanofungus camphoratus]|nr:hypothetical protein AcW2_006809 [Antrodia cinnamomea]